MRSNPNHIDWFDGVSGHVYPVVIFSARYGGAYEGAPWIALNEHTDGTEIEGAQADDLACLNFFYTYQAPIGRGSSPDQAYWDLKRQLDENPEIAWPRHL